MGLVMGYSWICMFGLFFLSFFLSFLSFSFIVGLMTDNVGCREVDTGD